MTDKLNAAWSALETLETQIKDRRILDLFDGDASRADTFKCSTGDMLLDYSKTNIDAAAKTALLELAEAANVTERRAAMFGGAAINVTEGRAVLHTALRNLDGGAVMVQSANGRIFSAIQADKKPFEMVWDSHVYDLDVWAIVKGSKKKALAEEFIRFATSSKPEAGMQDVAYGPTRKSSYKYVDKDVLSKLPSAHLDEGVKASGEFWADYGESLGEKFNEWLLK